MPTLTVLDLLTNALLGIRVHRLGAPLPPEMAEHALGALNLMLETWTVGRQLVYRAQEVVFPLSSAPSYTIGVGGQINTPRPSALRAGFTRVSGADLPYSVTTEEHYTAIGYKTQGGEAPMVLFLELAVPLGVVHVWPVSGGELHLMTDAALGPVAIGDSLSVPEGYQLAMTLALGEQVASTYGQVLDDTYRENQRKAETMLRRRNHQTGYATVVTPGRPRGRDPTFIYHG